MRNLLAGLAALAILVAVGLYAAGWLTYQRHDGRATIEIKTSEIENAAGQAAQDGKELLEEVIEQPVHRVDPEVNPAVEKPQQKEDLDGPVT